MTIANDQCPTCGENVGQDALLSVNGITCCEACITNVEPSNDFVSAAHAGDFKPLVEMSDEQLSNLSSEIHAELLRRFLDSKEV